MPDILIRGMEMPHIYDTVRFAMDVGSGKMFALNLYDENAEWHPVEELPPHGDLIDRDAILNAEKTKPIAKMMMFGGAYVIDLDVVRDAPVIIPTEKGE